MRGGVQRNIVKREGEIWGGEQERERERETGREGGRGRGGGEREREREGGGREELLTVMALLVGVP